MILAIIYSTALDMIRVNADKWPTEQEVGETLNWGRFLYILTLQENYELSIYKSFVLQRMENDWIHFIFCL